jgi:DNA-binding LacI/PurR family transcriptional regulator
MPRSSQSFHQKIAADLRTKIQAGEYAPGAQFPTETDLSARLHISRGTVRQALQVLVNEGLVERIAGKGTFIKPGGKAAETSASRLVGMVVPSLRDRLSVDMISGAERALRQQGYSLVFSHSDHDPAVEIKQIGQMISQQVRGIILFPLGFAQESDLVHGAQAQGVPVVAIDRQVPGMRIPTVQADNFGGAYSAVRHLHDLGHRRIACVTNSSTLTSVLERVRGYEQAMRDANLLPYAAVPLLGASTLMADATPPELEPGELMLVEHMLGVAEPPTAVFCINDFAAIGVMRRLLALGVAVPGGIAVAGFDNSLFAPYAPVPLTSVAQPAVEIGAKAAQEVVAVIQGGVSPDEVICLPTRLVVRESTAESAAVG